VNGGPKLLVGFAAALGSGLLIGIERERRKGYGANRALAGIRTFTLAALTGAAAGFIAAPLITFAGGMLIATLGAISHWRSRSRDPGVTTELALFMTYLVGIIATDQPAVAAGAAVIIAALLSSRHGRAATADDFDSRLRTSAPRDSTPTVAITRLHPSYFAM
jgi:hypothetical protein